MNRRLALSVLSLGLLSGCLSSNSGVTSGQIVAWDRDAQIVQLADGRDFYVPNRAWLSDLRPRRWVTIWYSVRDGQRVVVNFQNRNSQSRF